jgi:regulatory protein
MGFSKISLKGRALRYLAAREHSRAELERKLQRHEEEPGQLARVLDELEAKDFISEARVVESVVHRRASRMGGARIRQELQAKGIAPEAAAQAVLALQATELERARDVWRSRFGVPPADLAERARQMRFLLGRGFSHEVARKAMAQEAGDTDDST